MADNVTVDNADLTDYVVATDEITSPYTGGTAHAAAVKILSGTANANDVIPGDATNGLDVDVTRVPADPFGVNADAAVVTDASGSISGKLRGLVKWAFERMPASLGQKTMANSFPVVVASDQSAVPVSGTITANAGSGTFTVDSELTTADLDTGAGTDTRAVVGLVGSKSGGGALIPGDATAGLKVDLGADNDVTVTGTVAVTQSGAWDEVGIHDSGNSITVDAPVGTPVNVKIGDGTNTATIRDLAANDALNVAIVDGSGNQVTSFGGSGGTSMTDDAAFTPASTAITPIGAMFDNVAPDSVDEGDGGVVRMSANRSLYVNIRDNAGNERGLNVDAAGAIAVTDGGGSLTVDGTVTTSPSGDHTVIGKAADGAAVSGNPVLIAGQDGTNVQSLKTDASGELQVDVLTLPALAAGTNNIGDVDVLTVPAPLSTTGGGTEATALRVTVASDSTGVLSVDDNGGSLTVDGTVTVTDGLNVEGDVAHDGADSGNPVKQGAKAVAHGSNPTAVAAADRTDLYANRHGIQFTIGGHPNAVTATYNTTAAQTDDNILAAIATGNKYAITRITVTLDEATTVGVTVRIGFGATTVPALGASGADAVAGILLYHPGLVPGGGLTLGDGSGILGVGGDGEELRITCDAPTSGSLGVTVTYFQIES